MRFAHLKCCHYGFRLLFSAYSSFVGVFMLAGFLSSTFMNSAHTLGVDMVNLSPAPFSPSFSYEYRVASACLLALFICTLAAHLKVWPSFLPYVLEVFSGFSFGCGLFIGGMTRPAKVASFLTISSTLFDPTLLFVMVGRIAVAPPGFQFARSLPM